MCRLVLAKDVDHRQGWSACALAYRVSVLLAAWPTKLRLTVAQLEQCTAEASALCSLPWSVGILFGENLVYLLRFMLLDHASLKGKRRLLSPLFVQPTLDSDTGFWAYTYYSYMKLLLNCLKAGQRSAKTDQTKQPCPEMRSQHIQTTHSKKNRCSNEVPFNKKKRLFQEWTAFQIVTNIFLYFGEKLALTAKHFKNDQKDTACYHCSWPRLSWIGAWCHRDAPLPKPPLGLVAFLVMHMLALEHCQADGRIFWGKRHPAN